MKLPPLNFAVVNTVEQVDEYLEEIHVKREIRIQIQLILCQVQVYIHINTVGFNKHVI